VLDLAIVADRDIGADHHVLADRAIGADRRAAQDVREVPDLGAGAERGAVIDIAALVNEGVHGRRRRRSAHQRAAMIGWRSPAFGSTGLPRNAETISMEVRTSSMPKPLPARIAS